ncbi:uncharacterized protein RSE6_14184 [Rhynchosporium secalis]|uniref:Uncharacterized protein n=1 Tax=Rhynchosporium secalis TaxID=38038 RepID=A0A1E1MUM9_RHYSE|nr:uncharacterized protein RSE6_14184 [Rhynchosporium secalis]
MTETTLNDSHQAEKASFATMKPTAPDSHTPHSNAETTHGISSSLVIRQAAGIAQLIDDLP